MKYAMTDDFTADLYSDIPANFAKVSQCFGCSTRPCRISFAYRITTTGHSGTRKTARVKRYGDVLRGYEYHPESKCADEKGNPCEKQTLGLLQRRHIRVDHVRYIGKESNHLEEVDAGLVHCEDSVYTEYVDKNRDEWQIKILPALKRRAAFGIDS
jgi:hypothetical protein